MKPFPVVRSTLSRDDPQHFMAACCCGSSIYIDNEVVGGLCG
jgi:hypothetical protein